MSPRRAYLLVVGGDASPFVGSEMRALLQIRIPPEAGYRIGACPSCAPFSSDMTRLATRSAIKLAAPVGRLNYGSRDRSPRSRHKTNPACRAGHLGEARRSSTWRCRRALSSVNSIASHWASWIATSYRSPAIITVMQPHGARGAAPAPFAHDGPLAEQTRHDLHDIEPIDVSGRIDAGQKSHQPLNH
jgi:hypothetical protein